MYRIHSADSNPKYIGTLGDMGQWEYNWIYLIYLRFGLRDNIQKKIYFKWALPVWGGGGGGGGVDPCPVVLVLFLPSNSA